MKFVEQKYLVPFVAITSLFAQWGRIKEVTEPGEKYRRVNQWQ